MAHIDLIYKSNSSYLKAEDIGQEMPVFTIRAADVKTFDDGTAKVVCEFDETDKVLPLNKTNATSIADLYGLDTDGWIGKQVMLFTMLVEFNNNKVQAIRVRGVPRQQQRQNYGAASQSHQRPIDQGLRQAPQSQQEYDEMNPPPPAGYR